MKLSTISYLINIVGIAVIAVIVPRAYGDYQKKRESKNTFAIQNVENHLNLRPYNAGYQDNVSIIQYPQKNWECITWQMINIEDNIYLLKNLYSFKTLQPNGEPKKGSKLYQHTLEATDNQKWEFIKQSNKSYLIKLFNTELYLTSSDSEINSSITLMPLSQSNNQKWTLIEQHPVV